MTDTAARTVLCIEGGYKVTVITDGPKGLAEAQTNKYDIILLDLMLPNLTGIEILRALRDPARVPPLKSKIIITTNLDQRDDVRADIEKRADAYLVKAELTPRELTGFLDTIK